MDAKTLTATILAASLSASAWGARVYTCEDANGQKHFQQGPCDQGTDQLDYDPDFRSHSGGVSGYGRNNPLAREYQQRGAERRYSRQRSMDRYHDRHVTSGDREQIRRLENQKRDLQRDLDRVGGYGLGNWGKADAISDQIRGIDEQIMQLRDRPGGY